MAAVLPPTSTPTGEPGLRLAVIGDTHYMNPAYHREALAGRTGSPTDPPDMHRHAGMTLHLLPRMLQEVRSAAPDLVLQLGDVVQGHCDDDAGDAAELHEASDFLAASGLPLLFVRGSHEGSPGGPADTVYRDLFLPQIARTLGCPSGGVDTNYAVARGGCRIVVLDYTTFHPGGAGDRLLVEQVAEGARRGERLIICGHPPLVPVARPFFSRLVYAQTV